MGKNHRKNRRNAESGASGGESDVGGVAARLPVMQERRGGKVVTMAESGSFEVPEMLSGSKETSAGYQPVIKSFFKPLITPRGHKPRFVAPTSGVPPVMKKPWGYWRPQHKTATKSGTAITLWYYYETGDGPFADAKYGSQIGDAFWVKRENAPTAPKSAYENAYTPGSARQAMPSRVRIENTQSGSGYTSAGEASAWETDASAGKNAWASSSERKKVVKTKKQRDSEHTRTSDEDDLPATRPKRDKPSREAQREKSLLKMKNMPLHLRSLTAESLPAEVFGEGLPAGRSDAYVELKDFFPSRHYLMHYADIRAKYDMSTDGLKVMFGLCLDLDPDFPQNQQFAKWLVHKHLLEGPEGDNGETFSEELAQGKFKNSVWNTLAAGGRSSRERQLEAENAALVSKMTALEQSMQLMIQSAVAAAVQQALLPKDWGSQVEELENAVALEQRAKRVPPAAIPAAPAPTPVPVAAPDDVDIIFTAEDGTIPESTSSDLKLSQVVQKKL